MVTLGGGFLLAAPYVDGADDVQASLWAGGAFLLLGGLILTWAWIRARRT